MAMIGGCSYLLFYYEKRSPERFFNVATSTSIVLEIPQIPTTEVFQYIEVVDGCNPDYVGSCVNVRSGPGVNYPVINRMRTGMVLKVGEVVTNNDGVWYKIIFSNELLYPERVKGDWYVKADFVTLFTNEGNKNFELGKTATTSKHILVDISLQKLYAFDGEKLFMEESISTGLEDTPTPRGVFSVFKMTPSRFMQGPIPNVSDQVYDLPGVPWNLYFTKEGAVIHGAYWHDRFGIPWSHGCVNLSPENAKKLYEWAEIGTTVTVQR